MKLDYKDRELELLNTLLNNMTKLNSLDEKAIPDDIETNSMVQLGTTVEEKLFIINSLVESSIIDKKTEVLQNKTVLNDNVLILVKTLKNILFNEVESIYIIAIIDFPGMEIPCSNLFEAKKIANLINYDTNVIYKDQIIFTKS